MIVPNGNPEDIPLLIWIHGGSWRGGEKRIFNEFERFVHRGFAVLSIDYRFSYEASFPAQLEDCKTAVRWARAHAEKYGYNGDNIIVGGNSAGGHLAATASPICCELKGAPDYLLVFGTADGCIPLEKQGRVFRDALVEAGVNVSYLEIQGGGHGFDCIEFYSIMNEFMEAHT